MNGDSPTACVAALATENASASISASDCTAAAWAQTEGPFVVNAPLASRSQNHITFSDQSRRILGRRSPSCAIVKHGNDCHGAQALEARGVQFRH